MGNHRPKYKKKGRVARKKHLSIQPIEPIAGNALHSQARYTHEDGAAQREYIAGRSLSKWQNSLLDKKIMARNWLSQDKKFHIDIRHIHKILLSFR